MRRRTDWLESVNRIAASHGGLCTSKECNIARDRLDLSCKNGHRWTASASNVVNLGNWCKICSQMLDGINEACSIAKDRGGVCLSTQYTGNKDSLLWRCLSGHSWEASLYSVKNKKSWCPDCYNNVRSEKQRMKSGLDIAKSIAVKRGGLCLSSKYINTRLYLRWQCSKGHLWAASLNHIKDSNSWCKICGYVNAAKKANHSTVSYNWKTGDNIICVGSYEKKVTDYLNNSMIEYMWQPKTFTMDDGRTYRPDMYLVKEDIWVEIKGYFWGDALEKWRWFSSKYKNSDLWDEQKLKIMEIL